MADTRKKASMSQVLTDINKLNHVIVDQAFLILKCIHECFFADPVDHPRDPRRCFMDFIQCFRGKNILPASRIRHMAGDILFRFRTVQTHWVWYSKEKIKNLKKT